MLLTVRSMNDLPEELAGDFRNKWDEFSTASQDSNVPLPTDPEILSALKSVFAFSDFISEGCIRSPEILKDLIAGGDLQKRYGKGEYADKLSGLRYPCMGTGKDRWSKPFYQHPARMCSWYAGRFPNLVLRSLHKGGSRPARDTQS